MLLVEYLIVGAGAWIMGFITSWFIFKSYPSLIHGNFLRPDFSIKIPPDIASKIGLKIGDDVAISILDETNVELVVSKKFTGNEAKEKFRSLSK